MLADVVQLCVGNVRRVFVLYSLISLQLLNVNEHVDFILIRYTVHCEWQGPVCFSLISYIELWTNRSLRTSRDWSRLVRSLAYCVLQWSSWPMLPVLIAHQLWALGPGNSWPIASCSNKLTHALDIKVTGGEHGCVYVRPYSRATLSLVFPPDQYPILPEFNETAWRNIPIFTFHAAIFDLYLHFFRFCKALWAERTT